MVFEKKDITENELDRRRLIETMTKLKEWRPQSVQEILDVFNRNMATLLRQSDEWARTNKFINEKILHKSENQVEDIYVRTTEVERTFNTIVNIVEDLLKVTKDYTAVINYLNGANEEDIKQQISEIQKIEQKQNMNKKIERAPPIKRERHIIPWNDVKRRAENNIVRLLETKHKNIRDAIAQTINSYRANYIPYKEKLEIMDKFFSGCSEAEIIRFLENKIGRKIVRGEAGGQQPKTEDSNSQK